MALHLALEIEVVLRHGPQICARLRAVGTIHVPAKRVVAAREPVEGVVDVPTIGTGVGDGAAERISSISRRARRTSASPGPQARLDSVRPQRPVARWVPRRFARGAVGSAPLSPTGNSSVTFQQVETCTSNERESVLGDAAVSMRELRHENSLKLPPMRPELRKVARACCRERETGRAAITRIGAPLDEPAPLERGDRAAHLCGIDAGLARHFTHGGVVQDAELGDDPPFGHGDLRVRREQPRHVQIEQLRDQNEAQREVVLPTEPPDRIDPTEIGPRPRTRFQTRYVPVASACSGTHMPWKVERTRTGSLRSATGPSARRRASSTARSLRFSANRLTITSR